MALLTIGFDTYLMPSADASRCAQVFQESVRVTRNLTKIGPGYEVDGQVFVEVVFLRQDQVPPVEKPEEK